jgi:hypothetical protein
VVCNELLTRPLTRHTLSSKGWLMLHRPLFSSLFLSKSFKNTRQLLPGATQTPLSLHHPRLLCNPESRLLVPQMAHPQAVAVARPKRSASDWIRRMRQSGLYDKPGEPGTAHAQISSDSNSRHHCDWYCWESVCRIRAQPTASMPCS